MKLLEELEQTSSAIEELCDSALTEVLSQCDPEIIEEIVSGNEKLTDFIIDEAVRVIYKRKENKIVRAYRCLSGHKKGRIVNNPQVCVKKKDIKRSIISRRVNRLKRGIRIRKMIIAKKRALSKMVRRMNAQIESRYRKRDIEQDNSRKAE